jgi:hypothetical protein
VENAPQGDDFAVGAVYDRAFFPGINEIGAAIDRAYRRFHRFSNTLVPGGDGAPNSFTASMTRKAGAIEPPTTARIWFVRAAA